MAYHVKNTFENMKGLNITTSEGRRIPAELISEGCGTS